MKKVLSLVLASGTLISLLGTDANTSDSQLYSKCASCHGKDGKMVYAGKVKALAGSDKEQLIEKLKGYIAGTQNSYGMGAVMSAQAKIHLKSDSDIETVASYISSLKK